MASCGGPPPPPTRSRAPGRRTARASRSGTGSRTPRAGSSTGPRATSPATSTTAIPRTSRSCRQLGLGAYRFSIAWPRVVPDAGGTINRAGLDYYDRLVDELLANGITPYPTLFHWDLPQWMQDAGGWADRSVIGRFAEYADAVVRSLGDRIATWTVLNEPEVFVTHGHETGIHAPGFRDPDLTLRTSHVVNLAHAEGVRAVRAAAPWAAVGSAINMDIAYPASDDPRDVAAAERHHAWVNAWYLDPLLQGSLPGRLPRPGGGPRPDGHPARRHGVDGDDARLHRAQHVLAGDHRRRSGRHPVRDAAGSRDRGARTRSAGRSGPPRCTGSSGAWTATTGTRSCTSPRTGAPTTPARAPTARCTTPAGWTTWPGTSASWPARSTTAATSAATSRGRCSTTSSGRRATASASGSPGWTSTATAVGS